LFVQFVDVNREHPDIAVVTMNRPERLNALSPSLAGDMHEALAQLERTREVRAIVLAGAGRGFCSGYDLSDDGDTAPDTDGRGPVGSFYRVQQQLSDLVTRIHECEKPVVAAVHGAAVGGGLALALACDLRVAAPDVRFGSVFVRVGLSSCDMGVSYFLPRIVGATRAAELMLTGRYFGADEADRFGMLNAVSPEGRHVEAAVELAEQVAQHSEYSIWMTKSGMWANIDAPSFRHAVELENRTQALGTFTGNLDEYAEAFRTRRPPRWKPM
jgi:enoyl-CoA hydratase